MIPCAYLALSACAYHLASRPELPATIRLAPAYLFPRALRYNVERRHTHVVRGVRMLVPRDNIRQTQRVDRFDVGAHELEDWIYVD